MSITKIDGTTIDDAEHVVLVILRYNLTQYSVDYSETRGSHLKVVVIYLYFNYKGKSLGSTVADTANGNLRNATIAVTLNDLSNF